MSIRFVEGEGAAREAWVLAVVYAGRVSMLVVVILAFALLCRRRQPSLRAERALATIAALEPVQRTAVIRHLAPIDHTALAWGLEEVHALTSARPTASASALAAYCSLDARHAFRVWEPVVQAPSDWSAFDGCASDSCSSSDPEPAFAV